MRPFMRQSLRQPFLSSRTTTRPFSIARPLRLKEDKEQDPEHLEKTKQEQLKKQEKGEGHWHEELASASETHVAADKEKVHDHDEHMEDLQKQTAGQSEKDHPEGKSS